MNYLRRPTMKLFVCFLMIFTIAGFMADQSVAEAAQWTRFRGPNGTGHAMNKDLSFPLKWSEGDYKWKIKLDGEGHSSPVVWAEKLFITASNRNTGDIDLICLNATTGKQLWKKSVSTKVHRLHQFNSFASASPAVDESQVYITWSNKEQNILAAYSHSGEEKWQLDFGPYASKHGSGVSPIVYKDLVILPNDQVGKSFIVAVNRKTGKEVWRTPRRGKMAAYSTPCVLKHDKGEWLIFNSHLNGITAINPEDGKVVWEKDGLFDKRSVMSPVVVSGLVIGSCGSGGGGNYVVAVKPGSADGSVKPQMIWKVDRSAPYVPSAMAVDGKLYLFFDGGHVSCVDGKTGKVLYRERSKAGNFFGSPVYAGGKIYCTSRGGIVTVITPGDTFEESIATDLGEISYATPAIANGNMYLRTVGHLFCLQGSRRQ